MVTTTRMNVGSAASQPRILHITLWPCSDIGNPAETNCTLAWAVGEGAAVLSALETDAFMFEYV